MLGVLIGRNDAPLLAAYIQQLAPELFADVVVANIARLPAAAPPEPAGARAAAGGGGLAGLMQASDNYSKAGVGRLNSRVACVNVIREA